jgi:hypothetical protein
VTKVDRIHRRALTLAVALILGTFAAAPAGCSQSIRVGEDVPLEAGAPSFATLDAEVSAVEAGLTEYCPSNKCPAGWTACPGSRFPCDVDLKTDRGNCGACGLACPASNATTQWECVEGRCAMVCWSAAYADCDHAPDNGCETKLGTDDNCGFCGDKCGPNSPCSLEKTCGCDEWSVYCPGVDKCIDTDFDDMHCGECGNACEVTSGEPPVPNAYYGCAGGQCGRLKCSPNFANCDGVPSNGCEASILSRENCGRCGNVCEPGEECQRDPSGRPQCMCPAGQTYCPAGLGGRCLDLSTDRVNCGACGVECYDWFSEGDKSIAACLYGKCSMVCNDGWANCNGSESDECEVNVRSDPMNCGGCGNVCDAVAGQACVEGRCVVEPCGQVQDAGEVPR